MLERPIKPTQGAVDTKTANKDEMARRLSKLRVLDFRAHNPYEFMEHCARNSSSSLTHASSKLTRRTDVLFCSRRHVCNSLMGYLEG
jgi:hypothetical protein